MAYVFILLSVITGLIEGTVIKKYNARHEKGGFLFTSLISLFSMSFFLVNGLLDGGLHFSLSLLPYGLIAGFFYCSASFLTYVALSCGAFAPSMLVLSYSVVFSIFYGLFWLNEPANVFSYIGLAIVMVTLYLVRGESDGGQKKISLKWLICIGYSLFASGMFSVVSRIQQVSFEDQFRNEYMIIALGFSFVVLFIVGLCKDGRDLSYILRHGALYTLGAGVANGACNALGFVIFSLMPVSLSSPITAAVKIIVSYFISRFIFREKFLKRQLIGILLGVVAVVFLNIKI